MRISKKIILSFLLSFGTIAFAQIKEEKLILDRKREPEVKKIEKKKTSIETIKNYPPKEKKLQDSLNLKYEITDIPAASDFQTSTINQQDIAPDFSNNYHNNYIRFGIGNYGKILADGNISTTLENKMELGADVHFLSTNGLKKLYDWKSNQNTASIAAFLNNYGELGKFNLNVGYAQDQYNFYGIYAVEPTEDIDITQKINQIKVDGYYDFYSNEILNNVSLQSYFLSDYYDAKENFVNIQTNLSKHGLSITDDLLLNADFGIGLTSLNTNYKVVNENSNGLLTANLSPKMTIYKGKSFLSVGSDFTFINSKNNNLTLSEEDNYSQLFWFPKAEVQFAADEKFIFYAGIDGGLKSNTYADLLQENPYLLPDQQLKPTKTKYHFFAGLKGDITETLKYDFSAGFSKADDLLFFAANPILDTNLPFTSVRPGYDFENTFSSVYDNGKISEVKGEIQFFPIHNLQLGTSLQFKKYELDTYENILNKPLLKAEVSANYTMLSQKLNVGFKGIFMSDRTTNNYAIITTFPVFGQQENTNEKVGGFADVNLSAEYKIHKNFSIFALGNNLLNTPYQTYHGYKVLGAQILGGVKISF